MGVVSKLLISRMPKKNISGAMVNLVHALRQISDACIARTIFS
jgi:hypothetical protein